MNEGKRKALAEYLGVSEEDVTPEKYDDNEFDTPEGEYLVVTEEEAYQYVLDDTEQLIDDMGLDAFGKDFQDWILDNAVANNTWFDDAMRESYEFYADDIENESDSEFENRLVQEMYDANVISDDDLVENEDGLKALNDEAQGRLYELKETFVDDLCDGWNDAITWFRDNFGDKEFADVVKEHLSLDTQAIVDEMIKWGGVANSLERYDGAEIDLGNGLYAYRTN